MDWSNELVLEFLDLYKREPCIWNHKHLHHRHRKSVHNAWGRISKNLSQPCTIGDLKKKKDSLMATYRKLASRTDTSTISWFAYEVMATFLQSHANKTSEVLQNETIKTEIEESDNSVVGEEECTFYESDEEPVTTEPETFKAPPVRYSPNMCKRRKIEQIKQMEMQLNEAYEAYGQMNRASEEPKRGNCSLYGELLGNKLGELDKHTQEYAMLEIDKFVYELKQQKYAFQNHNSQLVLPVSTNFNQSAKFSMSTLSPQSTTRNIPQNNTTIPLPLPLPHQSSLNATPSTNSPASPPSDMMSLASEIQQVYNDRLKLSPPESSQSTKILQNECSTNDENQ